MKITGDHRYDVPRDDVWKAILDPEILSRILPGCEDLKQTGDNEFSGKLKMKVGPVQGVFQGQVTLSDLDPPKGYRMRIEGRGAPGFMNGDGRLELVEDGDGTLLRYEIDAQVGGRIASVGQRLLESSAKVITRQGLEGLGVQLDALGLEENIEEDTEENDEGNDDGKKADGESRPDARNAAEPSTDGSEPGAASAQRAAAPATHTARPPAASRPQPPSQAKLLGAILAGIVGDLVPSQRRPLIAFAAVLVVLVVVAIVLRTCA